MANLLSFARRSILSGWKKINFIDLVGVFACIIGFLFESIGDYQLSRFKTNPRNKGKVLDFGYGNIRVTPITSAMLYNGEDFTCWH